MLSTLAFNPAQPRDEQGQWTRDGGNAYIRLDKARLVFHSISVGDRGLESVELALHPDVKTDTWRGIDGMISVDWNSMPTGVTKENIVGSVKIYRHGDALTGSSLQVEEAYRRQGIATLLYDKVESEKGRLTPEFKQTSVGAAFWKSRSALSFPLAPAHGARLLLLASMRVNGGVGSGNFGHAGRPGQKGGSGEGGDTKVRNARSLRALKAFIPIHAESQRYAEANELFVRRMVGGTHTDDNLPVDVIVEIDGKVKGIEVKTMINNTNDKITMRSGALEKKTAWGRSNHASVHTVVVDDRGKLGHSRYSGHRLYYAKGSGSFRLSGMTRVQNASHLKELLSK